MEGAPEENLWVVPEASRLAAALGDLTGPGYDGRPWIELMMEGLPEIEQEVVKRRFGLGGYEAATFEDVGHALDYSRERIRQLQNQALGRIGVMADEIRERYPA